MAISLDELRRERLTSGLKGLFDEEFDDELSDFRAGQIVDFFLGALAPPVYNQAVQDARAFMSRKLEDLDGEVHESESF
jgi:uncharacterized protein (DUF2164 family)